MIKLKLKVTPASARNRIIGWLDDALKVSVTASANAGKANQAVIVLLADHLGVKKSNIVIKSGHHSARKTIELNPDNETEVLQKLNAFKLKA